MLITSSEFSISSFVVFFSRSSFCVFFISPMFLCNILNAWNIVIKTVSLSLFANSNLCFSSIDCFYLWWVAFFQFFSSMVIFDWMPYIVNFILLGTGSFYIPTNILELCSRTDLNYLKTILSYQVFALKTCYVEQEQCSVWD